MESWIGVAVLTAALTLGTPVAVGLAAQGSKPATQTADTSDAIDLSVRPSHARHYRHAYRPYYRRYYYARPSYYRPYPYDLPVPFFLGFGFGPWW